MSTESLFGDTISNRSGHSINYYKPGKCYIIYGGISDKIISGDLFIVTENTCM